MTAKKKGSRRRTAAEVVVRSVVKMPLGELSRFATKLANVDLEAAAFLLSRLRIALAPRDAPSFRDLDSDPGGPMTSDVTDIVGASFGGTEPEEDVDPLA